MSSRPPSRFALGAKPQAGDGAAAGGPSVSLGWARDLLTRSIGLEKRGNQLHVVLADAPRRLGAQAAAGVSLPQMRDELQARLLVHDPATQAVRNLYVVYKELGSNGWAGVGALPLPVLGRALAEAEMLQAQDPSPLLAAAIERLHATHAAAEPPIELVAAADDLPEWEIPAIPEVSETSFDEYEVMERSWIGTVPDELESRGQTR